MHSPLLLLLILFCACSRPEAQPASEPAQEAGSAAAPTALFLGDSLTAGYGVDPEDAWPGLVQDSWSERGLPWRARNAAISGSTTAGALEAAAWALTPEVRFVFVCIGANDGLRGTPLTETRANLDRLIARLKAEGRTVALAGMRLPPNYGEDYTRGFAAIFPELARKHGLPLMPFLLDGVAADPALNLPDGIHPNPAGHRKVADAVLAFLDREGLPK